MKRDSNGRFLPVNPMIKKIKEETKIGKVWIVIIIILCLLLLR